MTAVLQFPLDSYSLREAMFMWKEKGRYDWSIMLAHGEIVANSQPNMSKKTRPAVKLAHLNPFNDKPARSSSGIPLRGDMGERVLDACSVEEK